MWERIKNGKFILGAMMLLVLAIIIPVTINQVRKNQETRSRAAGEAVSVILDPLTANKNVGDSFNISVSLNGSQNNISATDITFTYDSNLLIASPFSPSPTFVAIVNDLTTPGTIHYVGVNPTSSPISGSLINLGTLRFQPKAAGTATVGFSNIHINASGVAGALPIDTNNTKSGTYIISGSNNNDTPTPTGLLPTVTTAAESPTPTNVPGTTSINLSLQMTGVGANSSQGLNNNPKQPQRNVEVGFFNAQNQNVLSTNETVNYNAASGLYKGNVNVNLPSGAYIVKVRLENTLWRQIPGIQNIVAEASHQMPTAILVSGDLNHDNEINLIDYNLFVACLARLNVCNDQ